MKMVGAAYIYGVFVGRDAIFGEIFDLRVVSSRSEAMRQGYSKQGRLDALPIERVSLNLDCRDEIVPILKALQHIYSQPVLRDQILDLIQRDINAASRADWGREGMEYWHILVLASARLGCDLTYDRLQDLAENHRRLRGIMGLGEWDEATSFDWRRLGDNIRQLQPATIEAISRVIVTAGHAIVPEAIKHVRADSFVMETRIHYPTESSIIRDGIEKVISLCVPLAKRHGLSGWRQHEHVWNMVRRTTRNIERIAGRKGPNYQARLQTAYQRLFQLSTPILHRARQLCQTLELPAATDNDVFAADSLQAYIARTERVQLSANRRVIQQESVPNSEKLFSMHEPHTQLYKRGKAGTPVQFGRQVLVFEDDAGFIIQHYVMPRDKSDQQVVVEQTRILQERYHNGVQRLSFDRGFHTPENQTELSPLVPSLCLPKLGSQQSVQQQAQADPDFLAAQKNHPGVESAIGALQSGNAQKRCRDRGERGYERYAALGILGRNLHTLGRLLIAQQHPDCPAAHSRRAT